MLGEPKRGSVRAISLKNCRSIPALSVMSVNMTWTGAAGGEEVRPPSLSCGRLRCFGAKATGFDEEGGL
jgi:hypothetical protein